MTRTSTPRGHTFTELFAQTCKRRRCWGLYVSFRSDAAFIEVTRAAPYINPDTHAQMLADASGVFFGTRKVIERMFWQTVGADGPTKTNRYAGPARVYALTCGPDGKLMDENT